MLSSCGEPWPALSLTSTTSPSARNKLVEAASLQEEGKSASREPSGVCVSWFFFLGIVYKNDMLFVELNELATAPVGSRLRIYRKQQVRVREIGTAFFFRVAYFEAR